MILDTKNETLDGVKLNELEYRFIAGLCNNRVVRYEELFDFVFQMIDTTNMMRYFLNLKTRLSKKIKLDIETRRTVGYILRNEVKII